MNDSDEVTAFEAVKKRLAALEAKPDCSAEHKDILERLARIEEAHLKLVELLEKA